MTEDNNVQKITRLKPMSKIPIGRPKTRWENDDLNGIKSMNVGNWKKVAQNRDSWKEAVEQARTLYRFYNLYKVLACSTAFYQLSLFCATFFQLRTFMLYKKRRRLYLIWVVPFLTTISEARYPGRNLT